MVCHLQIDRRETRTPEGLSRAIELAESPGDSANAWYGLGVASERAGRKKDAATAYERTLDIDPGYDQAREALKRVGR